MYSNAFCNVTTLEYSTKCPKIYTTMTRAKLVMSTQSLTNGNLYTYISSIRTEHQLLASYISRGKISLQEHATVINRQTKYWLPYLLIVVADITKCTVKRSTCRYSLLNINVHKH